MRPKQFLNIFLNNKAKLVFLFLTSLFLIILFFTFNFFYIKKIVLISDIPQNKIIGLQNLQKQNLLFFKIDTLKKELLQKNPEIKNVEIIKIFPNQLNIKINSDKAVAVIKAENGYFYLSEKGKIIEKQKNLTKKLPLINYSQKIYYTNYQAGQIVDYNEVIQVLRLLKKTDELGLTINTIDIVGPYMVAFNLERKKIIFSFEKKIEEEEEALETIIKHFQIEGKDFSTLDLRFNKPLIKVK